MEQYMAIDQYGQTYHALGAHPRKALLSQLGRRRAKRMYVDTSDGVKHIGWIIAGLWLSVYEVKPMRRAA